MTWSEILGIICGSGLISAGLTLLGECWLKRKDYKRDYYKKIIDKRLHAYEELEKFIGKLDVTKNVKLDIVEWIDSQKGQGCPRYVGTEEYLIYNCFYEEADLREALKESIIICGYSPWYSVEIKKYVDEFNAKLAVYASLVIGPERTVEKLKELKLDIEAEKLRSEHFDIILGGKVKPEFEELFKNINIYMLKDLKKLHEVDDFFNRKESNKL